MMELKVSTLFSLNMAFIGHLPDAWSRPGMRHQGTVICTVQAFGFFFQPAELISPYSCGLSHVDLLNMFFPL